MSTGSIRPTGCCGFTAFAQTSCSTTARRSGALRAEDLKKLGVVMKRAQYFLTCGGRYASPLKLSQEGILQNLMAVERRALPQAEAQQLSLFDQVG